MIFTDTKQRLRFAFAFASTPEKFASLASCVRVALDKDLPMPPAEEHAALSQDAPHVIEQVMALPMHESAVLVATYARDWDSRRNACDTLRDYFRPLMMRVIDDQGLLQSLVSRRYIAERERGMGWSLSAIAGEYGIAVSALKRADDVLDEHARTLESAALQSLEARLRLLDTHPA